jgi:dihydroxyacetone kinase
VHKIAGAAAEAGQSLEEVKAKAVEVIDNSATMGVSFSSVRRLKPEMIEPDKMEVGLGIHGEPGASVQDLAPSAKVVDTIMENVMASERMKAPAPEGYACLVNNLGSVPPVEMCIVTNDLMKSKWSSNVKLLIGPAQLCTSLDMNGISLSLLRLTPTFKELLCASTDARSWPAAVVPEFPALAPATTGLDPLEKHSPSSDAAVAAVIEKICSTLIDSKVFLDDLDSKVGDADCGSTMALASRNVLDMKDKLPQADPTAFCQCLGAVLGKTMGGSSGVLMAILWSAMATSFEKSGKKSWEEHGPTAFMDGLKAMMAAGGAEPGYRTMLDALVPAAEALQRGEGFKGAKAAAEEGALKTMSMAPRAGRSENVPKSVWEGVPDPGAKAVALAFGALA